MKRVRVTTNAANRLVNMPMERVTAKPLMGPVPNSKRIRAVMRVVIFASRTVHFALLKPEQLEADYVQSDVKSQPSHKSVTLSTPQHNMSARMFHREMAESDAQD